MFASVLAPPPKSIQNPSAVHRNNNGRKGQRGARRSRGPWNPTSNGAPFVDGDSGLVGARATLATPGAGPSLPFTLQPRHLPHPPGKAPGLPAPYPGRRVSRSSPASRPCTAPSAPPPGAATPPQRTAQPGHGRQWTPVGTISGELAGSIPARPGVTRERKAASKG